MSESLIESPGTEVRIRAENYNGVEVQILKSYGCAADVHSRFLAIFVHVRNNGKIYKYMCQCDTDWESLIRAKEWIIETIRKKSNPVPDMRQPLHYVLEATST